MEGNKKNILSFWQDKRLRIVAHTLTRAGYRVGIAGCTLPSGMPREIELFPDWKARLPATDIVLLPLPTLRDGERISFSEEEIVFSDLLKHLRKGTVLLVGMLKEERVREAREAGMTVLDYYDSEEVKLRNAVLTAEGALSIAMQELPIALPEARAAVVGCGRIGNALCRILKNMGADVTAYARRKEALLEAERVGCHTALLTADSLRDMMQGYDVVFSTVPAQIFSREVLKHSALLTCGRKTLYIDLSSVPGGFDPAAAREYGIKLLWALSLPGKYAPDSAGRVLGEQMLALLQQNDRKNGKEGAI